MLYNTTLLSRTVDNGSEVFLDEVRGKLFPVVSVHGKDDILRVNFGAEKFLFDTDSFLKVTVLCVIHKLYVKKLSSAFRYVFV